LRGLVADALWLKLHARWEEADLAAAEALVRRVSEVDPEPVYFWQNGARIIGYDLPAWRIREEGGYERVPGTRQRAIVASQARAAVAHLQRALTFHPDNGELWIERANLEYRRMGDLTA